jgi:malate dehydrogenase (oxaloacetate-decarboxylating)
VSASVAVAVARRASKDGVAQAELSDPVQAVEDAMWRAGYPPLTETVNTVATG